MCPLKSLRTNPFVLAPMAGITDHAFRSFMKTLDASVVVTELVSANGIEYKSDRTMDLMSFDESQRPVGIQLFGEDPRVLSLAAKVAQDQGCDFVDLNFGCPVPKVTKKGAGSAMLKDLPALTEVLRSVKSSIEIPLTIKIRTGWDASTRNATEVCHIAQEEGILWVAIHGRTRAQNYSGVADWDYIREVKANCKIPIIGNGDILTARQAIHFLQQSQCDGVMIGRGSLKNPYIFSQALNLWKSENGDLSQPLQESAGLEVDFVQLYLRLREYIVAHCDDHIVGIQLKKFASWFSTGHPGASNFRKNIFQAKSNDEIMDNAVEFFRNLQSNNLEQPNNTGDEPFLMGGHG